ncbi:MAG: copper resistance protein CopC, partial [Chloroflexota bacterium]
MRWDNCIFNKLIFAVFMAVILVFLLPLTPSAQAHAILTHSDPETGAALPAAPPRVTLEFSEAIDPDLSKVKLAGADLKDLVPGPGNFDPNEDRFLTLDLPVLPDGAYNIIWQARSAVDGHISSGVVTFSIGEATSRASLLPPPGADDPTQALPPLPDTLIRWLAYAAAALLVGGVLFGWLVWRPAYRAWGSRDPGSDRLAAHRLRQLIRTGIAALAALSLGTMLFQTWEAGRGDFQISYSQALAGLLEPQSGWAFWLRLSLLGFLAYLTRRLTHPGEGSPRIWQAAAVVSLAILLTFSLQSHVAA